MNMIKKLSQKNTRNRLPILLFCWGLGGVLLWLYGPDTIGLLQGKIQPQDLDQSVSNYYVMCGVGMCIVLMGLWVLIIQLAKPIKKRVSQYLKEHPAITLEMLDQDFEEASQYGNIWVSRKFTYGTDIKSVILENSQIVLIYHDVQYIKNKATYYFHWCMVDGQQYQSRIPEQKLQYLRDLYASFPHILTENSPDYKYMFKHNMNELLNIKYNQSIQQ